MRRRNANPLLAVLLSLATLALAACTSSSRSQAGSSATASRGSLPASPSTEGVAPTPTISVGDLQGRILFTRAGGNYGDETVFTADADGTHEQRITGFGKTCCPRWSPDGTYILIAAFAPDDRGTTGSSIPTVPTCRRSRSRRGL